MDMSFQARPFGFERIFADAAPPGEALGDAATLAIELESLRAEREREADAHRAELARARVDGFEAGLVQARGDREAALLSATDALHAEIESLAAELDRMRVELGGEAAQLALAAARFIAGDTLDRIPAAAIDAAMARALAQVPRGTELLIRVHPDLADAVRERIAARQAADRRNLNLHLVADAETVPGDARIEWDAGGLTLDRAQREAALLAEIASLLTADAETEEKVA